MPRQFMEFEDLPFSERPDLTPYLLHLTKRSMRASAFDNLVSILKSGRLRSSGREGFIRGPNRATCFMDVPFTSLKYILNKANTDPVSPKYEPYGIVISKKLGYGKGLRPVLYLSEDEIEELRIPDDALWRVVKLEVNDAGWISWLHEREWRAEGGLRVPKNALAVLVHHLSDVKKLRSLIDENPSSFKVKPQSIIPLDVVCQGLIYINDEDE